MRTSANANKQAGRSAWQWLATQKPQKRLPARRRLTVICPFAARSTTAPRKSRPQRPALPVRFAFLIVCLFLLSGCWDRKEVNDIAIVTSIGVDKDEGDSYTVSLQIPLPGKTQGGSGSADRGGGGAGGKAFYVQSDTGRTLQEATEKLQKHTPRRLFQNHRRTYVIGEKAAKEGIGKLLDYFPQASDVRLTSNAIVAQGKAIDLLLSRPQLEMFSSEALREIPNFMGMKVNMKDVLQMISHPGADITMYYMGLVDVQAKSPALQEPAMLGYAQFKDDRMVGTFTGSAAQGLMWLKNDVKPFKLFMRETDGDVTGFEIAQGKLRIKCKPGKNGLVFSLKGSGTARIIETSSAADLSLPEQQHAEELELSRKLEASIRSAIKLILKNEADSAGFGLALWRQQPGIWTSAYKENWPAGLKKATFNVTVDMKITEVGRIAGTYGKERRHE